MRLDFAQPSFQTPHESRLDTVSVFNSFCVFTDDHPMTLFLFEVSVDLDETLNGRLPPRIIPILTIFGQN